MKRLAENGVDPQVIDDQVGRITYADDLAAGIVDLLQETKPYGTYNVTSGGDPKTWFDIAREAFAEVGQDSSRVTAVSTEDYGQGKELAPRPKNSVLE